MRIVSLLPSATEIICDLGLADSLVGRSIECNWPPEVAKVPVVSTSYVDSTELSGLEIDAKVREAISKGIDLYQVDDQVLRDLAPDFIITQDLCKVCAVSSTDVCDVGAQVLSLNPKNLAGVIESITKLASDLGVPQRGIEIAETMRSRIEAVRLSVIGKKRIRVFMAEWLDPPFASGHWIPEMVEAAGGLEVLGQAGQISVSTTWEKVFEANPELIVLAPCGFDDRRAIKEAQNLKFPIPTVAVNSDRFFVRPSASLAEGVEQLAVIFDKFR